MKLELQNVRKVFKAGAGDLEALADVSFSVAEGSFVSIVGVSGCGKTTLLKIIASLLKPTSGIISIQGENKRLGYIPQTLALFPWLDVYQNVLFPLELASAETRSENQKKIMAQRALSLVDLLQFQHYSISQLSGGMQQRVAIARAIVAEPRLLLMDEPFRALDEISRERLNCELLRIWSEIRPTTVMVTHSLREAVFLSQQVIVLSPRPGRVVEIFDIDLDCSREAETEGGSKSLDFVNKIRAVIG